MQGQGEGEGEAEAEIEPVLKSPVDDAAVARDEVVFVDASCTGAKWAVERGRESLLVSAAVVSVQCEAVQGVWVSDGDMDADAELKNVV